MSPRILFPQSYVHRLPTLLTLAPLLLLGIATADAGITINEFVANNGGMLRDEDLQSPDWIELHNNGTTPVNLAGWHLTDDPSDPQRWTFPATNLPAGGFLVVFASGKDRAVSGRPLHTNFQLSENGEYLGLVEPGGVVAHAYSPAFPIQRENVSYGLETPVLSTSLISSGAVARVLVPTDGNLGATWTAIEADDSTWTPMATPAAFVVGVTAASVLAFDVNARTAPGLNQPGFNSFLINSTGGNTAIQTQPTVRSFGSISVTLSNTTSAGYNDRSRSVPGNNGAFTESLLLRDFVFSQDTAGTGGLNVNVAGLTPNTPHRITVWSFDGQAFGNKVADWYANGVLVRANYTFNPSAHPTSNDQYRFTFDATSSGSGTVLISGRRDTSSFSFGAYLNAMRVERLTTQPPTNVLGQLMASNNATAYLRFPFTVSNPSEFYNLRLRMRYDDGFVAYINGQVVASRNAPGLPQWNSSATTAVPDQQAFADETIVFANTPGLLQSGLNVLAIHGMNVSAADPDFYMLPELEGLATGAVEQRYFSPPTPGAANGTGYLGLVANTQFSVERGFFETPFAVSLSSETPGASIYWTTNGSIPSPTNGTLYTGPVQIPGTRLLRAAAYRDGYLPSVPDTHSYIFLSQVLQQPNNPPGYPAAWQGGFAADYGMDPNIVNHPTYGPTLTNDLRAIPTLSLVSDHASFWDPATGIFVDAVNDRGERPVSAELFNGDNTTEFQINCAIQMHGQAGRDNERTRKHSSRLEFSSSYGPSKLEYDWFGGGVIEFDSIILRNSWADTWTTRYDPFSGGSHPYPEDHPLRYRPENATYLRDLWVKQAMRDMGYLASRGRYVHVYINGLYWGIYAAIERLDTTYFANHLGGYEKDWDIMKDYSELQDGSRTDWDSLMALVNQGINDESDFQAVAAHVDIENLIDYFLLHALVEANDWLQESNPHNWYGAHRRANPTNGLPATKWIFLPWDQEIAFNRLRNDDRVNGLSNEQLPSRIYNQLRAYPEFRRMYGDRVQKHLFNGGALSPSNNVTRLQSLAAEIDQAIVAESARWGDTRESAIGNDGGTGVTLTRDEYWIPELQKLYTNWFPNVMHQRTIARLQAAGLYPTIAAPEFSQFGGAVSNGFSLTIMNPNGTGQIYFTSDGSDPREYGTGLVANNAQSYEEPIEINSPTVVRARVFDSGNWSALVEAPFFPPQDLSKLALTEIMYNPPAFGPHAGNTLEFLELKNTGTNTLDLSGLTFTSGITFTFPTGTLLGAGEFFVLARNAIAFAAKYPGVAVHGTYTGQLDNAGEQIRLSHPLGTTIFSVTYDDRPDWPVGPDVADFSLVQTMPGLSQAPDRGNRWRASTNPGGSPGADDPPPTIPPIVISEVLAHTDPPLKDSIELYNPTAADVNVGGWFLTDEADTPLKFRIPDNTVIPANDRIYFDEDDFNSPPGGINSFRLSSLGDDVHLFSADTNGVLTGYNHSAVFGASFNGVSFGRYVNSAGDEFYPAQIARTLGFAEAGPIVGPIVISEIHYHPDANGDEFVELLNISAQPVPLYDVLRPTNTWRITGLGFTLPPGITLEAGERLVIASINPSEFRAKYNVPANVMVVGPYAGRLQNGGENLELQMPDEPNTDGIVPYVTIDAVRYNDTAPWPAAADGGGFSLQRSPESAFGNEPSHWIAAAPTPGTTSGDGDSDGDGLPDSWEIENGTLPFVADAGEDPDGDGLTNWEEFLAGTLPNDPESVLQIRTAAVANGQLTLEFLAAANRTYSILYSSALESELWLKVEDIPAHPTNRLETVIVVPPGSGTRFYKVVTPKTEP